MSFVQADIDTLDEAIKRGVTSVTLASGQSIRYASMDELIQARSLAVHEVGRAAAEDAGHSTRYSLAKFT